MSRKADRWSIWTAIARSFGRLVEVYLTDIGDFSKMNVVYGTYFKDIPPARATVEVSKLTRNLKVEISAIARK